jgi:hypothetical protein
VAVLPKHADGTPDTSFETFEFFRKHAYNFVRRRSFSLDAEAGN